MSIKERIIHSYKQGETMKQYVIYLRVSTQKQGRSGLGLEAQRKMCEDFITRHKGALAKEFIDVESGTHRNRKGLAQAIEYCKQQNTPLVIAKLDRLARDVEFCFKVVNTGIEIHFTDMPQMNTLLLGVFASVAQYERELTSDRTKQALAAKKARGEKIGAASDNYNLSQEQIAARASKAALTRSRRVLEHRDTQVLIKIMKQVFDQCATTPEREWQQSFVNTKYESREKIFQLMRDYKEIDDTNKLFAKWDLSTNDAKFQMKLADKLNTIVKLLNKAELWKK